MRTGIFWDSTRRVNRNAHMGPAGRFSIDASTTKSAAMPPSIPSHPPFPRRGFMVTMLASGCASAVRPVSGDTITTDADGPIAGEAQIPVPDGKLPEYRASATGRALRDHGRGSGDLRCMSRRAGVGCRRGSGAGASPDYANRVADAPSVVRRLSFRAREIYCFKPSAYGGISRCARNDRRCFC